MFSKAPSDEAFNLFVQSLSPEQRTTLATILHMERTAAIHDVLAVLSWWVDSGGVSIAFQGQSMPVDISGTGMHGDYVGRSHGWEWPANDGSGD